MTATMIDLDDEALEGARLYLGTTTKKDTVNRALREMASRREELLRRMSARMEDTAAEYEQLDEAAKSELRSRFDTTDHPFRAQVAAVDALQAGNRST